MQPIKHSKCKLELLFWVLMFWPHIRSPSNYKPKDLLFWSKEFNWINRICLNALEKNYLFFWLINTLWNPFSISILPNVTTINTSSVWSRQYALYIDVHIKWLWLLCWSTIFFCIFFLDKKPTKQNKNDINIERLLFPESK